MTARVASDENQVSDGSDVTSILTRVLYVQAPGHPRTGLPERLQALGYRTSMATDASDALRQLAEQAFAICLIDLAGGRSTLTTVRLVRARHAALPVAAVIDPASPAVATEAIHSGIADLLTWPFDALDLAALIADIRDRAPAGVRATAPEALVAFSPAMRDVLAQVRDVAGTRQTVCLVGARGTGKSLVARALHLASAEAAGPFITVDCADRSPSEIETILFGAPTSGEGRATTTGVEAIAGDSALARARGGTLVVAHFDEAPARVQLHLMSILRDREVVVGRTERPVDLNVRLVGTITTGGGPGDDAAMLRPELAARFALRIELPPLRRRREDIPMLAARYLDQRGAPAGRPLRFSRAALELLSALPWPGHVPELEQLVDAVLADARRPVVQIEDVLRRVSLDGVARVASGHGLREAREQFERECIEAALARHQGRVGEAARALGIQRTNLYRKVRQLGISRALLSSHR
jgi:DNA-binding NtrC family response regulator